MFSHFCWFSSTFSIISSDVSAEVLAAGNQMKWSEISLGLSIVGNTWDNVSTQLDKMFIKSLVMFGHVNVEMLQIMSLNFCAGISKEKLSLEFWLEYV